MTQTGKHTPGPWRKAPGYEQRGKWYGHLCIHKPNGGIIAMLPKGPHADINEANARLIAAAPEMLSELKRDLQFAREMRKLMEALKGRDWVQYELAVQRIEALETIIARAEGR